MTAQNAMPKSVHLSLVLKQIRTKLKSKKCPVRKMQASSLSRDLERWGDIVVYDTKVLRDIVAESIAYRLRLSPRYVKNRLDAISRIACYDETPDSGGVEG